MCLVYVIYICIVCAPSQRRRRRDLKYQQLQVKRDNHRLIHDQTILIHGEPSISITSRDAKLRGRAKERIEKIDRDRARDRQVCDKEIFRVQE